MIVGNADLVKARQMPSLISQLVDLKPGGSQIPVTESNKQEYLDLLAQYRLSSSVKQEIEAFAKGSLSVNLV